MSDRYNPEMYDVKYSLKEEDKPRSVVVSFVDKYLTPGQNCLDLGCGAGRHSRYAAEKGVNVTAVDMSGVGVEKTKKLIKDYPRSSVLLADIRRLPFKDESFDSLISNRVLDYNNDEGLESAFSEIGRVLKEQGLAFVTLRSSSQPLKENEVLVEENKLGGRTFIIKTGNEQGNFQHYFTEQEVRSLAERHRLEVKEIREQQKNNQRGEFKAEWQVVLQRMK